MIHRWFSLTLMAITLSSCHSALPEATVNQPEPTDSPAGAAATGTPPSNPSNIANVNLAPEPPRSPESSVSESENSPEEPAPSPAVPSDSPVISLETAASPEASAGSAAETAELPDAKPPDAKPPSASITIDESICGAGGQEAYFETKIQEIYICKNESGALTYIATPKKKGNSQFLPAQKVHQGDVTGYIALDQAKTYIVTPGGFQLQDDGQTQKSEKVIRRQLAQP